jgi:hypothetical protein
VAVGQKWVTPSEFWAMPPGEIWWLVEANEPPETGTDFEELYQLMNEAA